MHVVIVAVFRIHPNIRWPSLLSSVFRKVTTQTVFNFVCDCIATQHFSYHELVKNFILFGQTRHFFGHAGSIRVRYLLARVKFFCMLFDGYELERNFFQVDRNRGGRCCYYNFVYKADALMVQLVKLRTVRCRGQSKYNCVVFVGSRDISFSVVTSLRAGIPRNLGSSSDFDWGERFLPLPTRADRLRAPPSPLFIGYRWLFPVSEVVGTWSWQLLVLQILRLRGARPLFPLVSPCAFMACTGRTCVLEVRTMRV